MYCYCDDEGPSESLHFNWMPQRMAEPPVPNSIDGAAVLEIIKEFSRHDPRNNHFFAINTVNRYQAEFYNPVTNKIAWTWNRKFVERELHINKCCCNFAQHLNISFVQGHNDLILERDSNDMNDQGPDYPKLDQQVGRGWVQPWHFDQKPRHN